MLHAWICWSVRPPDPERQTKRRVRNIGAARVRPSFFRQRTNRKEGRKALARRRPNNRGRARGGLSGVCHVQLRVVASGRNSPVALLSLLPGSSSVPPSPSVQSGTQIYERRAAVKQSGKREWQAGRGNRHDGRRRQRHYRRNRRGSTGSRSNRARRGNCWDKTLLG